jgi:hypothetical protein
VSFLRLFVVCSSHTHTASPTVGHADVTSDVTGASGGTAADVTPRDSDMGSAEPDDDDDGEDEDEDDEDATLRFRFLFATGEMATGATVWTWTRGVAESEAPVLDSEAFVRFCVPTGATFEVAVWAGTRGVVESETAGVRAHLASWLARHAPSDL